MLVVSSPASVMKALSTWMGCALVCDEGVRNDGRYPSCRPSAHGGLDDVVGISIEHSRYRDGSCLECSLGQCKTRGGTLLGC